VAVVGAPVGVAPVGVAPEVDRMVTAVVTAVAGWQVLRLVHASVLVNFRLLNRSWKILRQPTSARYAQVWS